ncbi:MAG: helix-turn-helix domain-containing protein, partial [Tumebacillaceae bacterium]
MNEAYAKIGQRVKSFRKECGLSQDELAEGICSRQTISLLENGQHFPSVEFMQKIAARLAIPLAEIMVDEVTELELKVQLDLIKIYVEIGDYKSAYELAEELEKCEELLEYQMRELILYKADCLMRTGKATEAVEILMSLQHKLEKQRVSDDHLLATVYDKLGTAY